MNNSKPQPDKRKKIDWEAMKAAFLQGREGLNEFRLRNHIENATWFYKKVKEAKWLEARGKLEQRTLEKIEAQTVKKYADEWEVDMQVFKGLYGGIIRLIKRKISKDETTFTESELNHLASAAEKILKGRRLILGESTENVKSESLHMAAVRVIRAVREGADVNELAAGLDDNGQTLEAPKPLQDQGQG